MTGVEVILASGIIAALVSALFNMIQARKTEELRQQLDERRFVHRVQFEEEFTVYKALWVHLQELEESITTLRTLQLMNDMSGGTEPMDPAQLGRFQKRFEAVRNAFRESRPFFSETIYGSVRHLLFDVCADLSFRATPGFPLLTAATFDKISAELQPTIDRICDAIRERIGTKQAEDHAG